VSDTTTVTVETRGSAAIITLSDGKVNALSRSMFEQLNAAIDAIRGNGVYKKINDKYFDFDVYGAPTS